jgi:hypothetical protein
MPQFPFGGSEKTSAKATTHFCSKSSLKNQQNTSFFPDSPRRRPRFLWGIPTFDSAKEKERRQTIRETYLSFFQNSDETPHRICSLSELTCQVSLHSQCQLVYTFFMGSNPKASPELLGGTIKDFRSMMTQEPIMGDIEADVVYLDIRENQFDGKMTTWFKFASLVAEEFDFIEYIAKVDTDTLVFTPNFLQYMEQHLPSSPQRVHGGTPFLNTSCDLGAINHDHPCPLPLVGDVYMSGELNFMSVDLARYITSKDCPRDNVTIATHEDVSLSNYVFSHPQEIHVVEVPGTKILITRGLDAEWHTVDLKRQPEKYLNYLWGHSPRKEKHEYFKSLHSFWKMWDKFSMYWTDVYLKQLNVRVTCGVSGFFADHGRVF